MTMKENNLKTEVTAVGQKHAIAGKTEQHFGMETL